jgi:CRISPR/Cas system-associated exonuclease Cas4 (RecB family)
MKLTTIDDLDKHPTLAIEAGISLSELHFDYYKKLPAHHRAVGIHASELCTCLRQVGYTLKNFKKVPQVPVDMAQRFEHGSALHEMIQRHLRYMANMSGHRFKFEAEVSTADTPLGKRYGITSSCDGVCTWFNDDGTPLLRIGLEIKTESPDEWAKLKAPRPKHVEQATVYQACLDLPLMYYLYYNKGTQQETPMNGTWMLPFNKEIWSSLEDKIDRVLETHYSGGPLLEGKKAFHCRWCPYQHDCQPAMQPRRSLEAELKEDT